MIVLLAGCASPTSPDEEGERPIAFTPCEHPWPCADGSEWPPDLAGPFEVLPPEELRLESHDGTIIAGHVWRPDVPEGVRVPVIIFASPYFSQPQFITDDLDFEESTSYAGRFQEGSMLTNFTSRGYALLLVSVRGTGESGGCFGWGGLDEQLDQIATVEWAATQQWSNGRVGYWGISYMGTTSWEAAIHAPEALKAVWAGGIITDWYLNGYSVQGLSGNGYSEFSLGRFVEEGLAPPVPGESYPTERIPSTAPRTLERACPGTPDAFLRHTGTIYVDERKPEWFGERRYVDRFADVTAAVMVTQGLQDNSAHRFQEDIIWNALPNAPKWFLQGQWGHTVDFDEALTTYPHGTDDWTLTFEFFDFWLKGLGDPPRLGKADYQTTSGTWRESSAWPPSEARDEALYLGDGALATTAQEGAWSFLASPASGGSRFHGAVEAFDDERGCGPEATRGTILLFVSEPVRAATIAGNPFALLTIESDRQGGGFNAELISFAGDSPCADPSSVRVVAAGGVDLRFHDGVMVGHDFPTGTKVDVRVDLWNTAHDIEEGERLALVLQPPLEETQPWTPTITVHGGSHLVLPVVEGTLGGGAPPLAEYPARPFTP